MGSPPPPSFKMLISYGELLLKQVLKLRILFDHMALGQSTNARPGSS